MKYRFVRAFVTAAAMLAPVAAHAGTHHIIWEKSFREVRVAKKLKLAECPYFRGKQLSPQLILQMSQTLPKCPQFQPVGEAGVVPIDGAILFYFTTDQPGIWPGEYTINPKFDQGQTVNLRKKIYVR